MVWQKWHQNITKNLAISVPLSHYPIHMGYEAEVGSNYNKVGVWTVPSGKNDAEVKHGK